MVSIAPMMDRTDRHYRWFMRRITERTLLYTEMVTAWALLHGDAARHLDFDASEHPIALQLGGDDAGMLTECARMAADWGYDEVNLNVGCPSERVQGGNFGACLMTQPEVVARAVEAMRAAVDLPVTVKHRIGVDDVDRYEDMKRFVDVVSEAGADRFTVHARKAWLEGLSPKENREIPPLRYDEVYRLKAERPDLQIEINGGIKTLADTRAHLEQVDAVMIGRSAYDDPWLFAGFDEAFFGEDGPARSRAEVARDVADYAEGVLSAGGRLHHVTRHLAHLFAGVRGARAWRRHLSTHAVRRDATPQVLLDALAAAGLDTEAGLDPEAAVDTANGVDGPHRPVEAAG